LGEKRRSTLTPGSSDVEGELMRLRELASLPEENPNPVLRATPEGNALYANEAARATPDLFADTSCSGLALPLADAVRLTARSGQAQMIEFETRMGTLAFSLTPVSGASYINLYGSDITAHKRSEEQLSESRQTLQVIIDTLPAVINAKDRHGRFFLANPAQAAFYGLSPKDMLDKTIDDIADAEYARITRERDEHVFSTGEALLNFDDASTDARGNSMTWYSTKVPLFGVAKRVKAVLTVSIDITERTRTEEALRHAKEEAEAATVAKSRFLANMSHELRTPLNAVIGITEMLHEDAETLGHAELVEPLDRIHNAGRHLLNLINDILDLAKIESDKIDLNLEEIDIQAALTDAIATAQPLAQENHNELLVKFGPSLGTMWADATRTRQIVLNLLSNACKFTTSGEVRVFATRERRTDGDQLKVIVADTGIGIAPDHLPKLFDEFHQADSSTTRRYGGTGLGLAISHRLVKLMGGNIDVESGLGVGSTFTMHLPCDPAR
jgi:PAS domain S-box-containing protein